MNDSRDVSQEFERVLSHEHDSQLVSSTTLATAIADKEPAQTEQSPSWFHRKWFDQLFLSGKFTLKRLRGSLLFIIGYLLSPLCWWNDLVFNLPIAYLFGFLCSRIEANWLLPGMIVGYWLSNIAGILLMQFGVVDVFQGQDKPHNLKKELITGVVSSTAYTVLIVTLVHLKILQMPDLFSGELLSLNSLFPFL